MAVAEDKEQLVAAGGPVVVYRYWGAYIGIAKIITCLLSTLIPRLCVQAAVVHPSCVLSAGHVPVLRVEHLGPGGGRGHAALPRLEPRHRLAPRQLELHRIPRVHGARPLPPEHQPPLRHPPHQLPHVPR